MRFLTMVLGFLAFLLGATLTPDVARAADGKELFLKHKCNECHALSAAGIELAPGEDAGEEDPFGGEAEGEDEEAPDLSSAGKEQTAAWIADYLKKKEKLDGKKHRKRFKGPEAELKALSEYLAGMKGN